MRTGLLTTRQMEVLRLLTECCMQHKEIAAHICISTRTVDTYVGQIRAVAKLDTRIENPSFAEIMHWAIARGFAKRFAFDQESLKAFSLDATETEVLRQIATGLQHKEAAQKLGMPDYTLEKRVAEIHRLIQDHFGIAIPSLAHLVNLAFALGLVSLRFTDRACLSMLTPRAAARASQ